ncbi:PEP-CTERM sorting domain-containing protein [Catenovulum maritimum]|uniref:Ice-binding protein C-terminal domain-containing protein n=1 Tax=Catenovulum maritimum TaxID=1513271 RepID=A0A0J8GU18_9ALTE|nr:PEP-CTERM sorting domain-containing protein [Catenovulum maritimum]KMT64809.1 hypothetical protein XM47_12210 [Catenovulum maritimum]
MKNILLKGFFTSVVFVVSGLANAGLITENFDDGEAQGWTLTGLWHVTGNNPNGTAGALGYVQGETTGTTLNGNFNTGGSNSGTATTGLFQCLDANAIGCSVNFDSLDSAETGTWDQLDVYLLHGGAQTLILDNNGGSAFNDSIYRTSSFDLSNLLGNDEQFQLRFSFATLDGLFNDYTGPRIDNFVVNTGVEVPEPSTLAIFALSLVGLVARRRKKA